MADQDEHLHELARQVQGPTALGRLSHGEVVQALKWLEDNGHMGRSGKPLETPVQAPRVEARKADGSPIYSPGADFSTHRTVTLR